MDPRSNPAAMADVDAKQHEPGTNEEKSDKRERQKWNVEAEPFHPYVGSMIRPLTRGETRAGHGGQRIVTPPPPRMQTRGESRASGEGSCPAWGVNREVRDPGKQYEYGTWHQPRGTVTKNSKADEKGNTKGLLKGSDQRRVTFEVEPPMVIPVQQSDPESNSSSG